MMQVMPKWKIQYNSSMGHIQTIYIHDNFYSNVLRKTAEIEVESKNEVEIITITKVK